MPLFSGVPYITETPAEAMRNAPAGNRNIVSGFQGAYQQAFSGAQQRQREAALEPLRRLAYEADMTRAQASAYEAQSRMVTAQAKLDEIREQSTQQPILAEWQARLGSNPTLETLNANTPPATLTGANREYALNLYSQLRLAISSKESMRLRQEQITSTIERNNEIMRWRESQPRNVQAMFDQQAMALRQAVLNLPEWSSQEERMAAYSTYVNELDALVKRLWPQQPSSAQPPPAINDQGHGITVPQQPEEKADLKVGGSGGLEEYLRNLKR